MGRHENRLDAVRGGHDAEDRLGGRNTFRRAMRAEAGHVAADTGLDRAIETRLHRLFDPVLFEPIPDRLLQILRRGERL